MSIVRPFARSLAFAFTLSTLLLSGCRIDTDKNGKHENVDISTPFGSMKVKTNDGMDTSAIGIKAYPGSVPVSDDKNNDDKNAADVDLSFGDFHLGVKAASFQTSDAPDKVMAFYRTELAHFGDVIECQNKKAIGTPTHTSQGLTCDEKENIHGDLHINDDSKGIHINGMGHGDSQIELRTGSEQHQHIVGIEPRDGGTRIGLVMLNLPVNTHSHSSNDSE